jgi:glucose uptake protein
VLLPTSSTAVLLLLILSLICLGSWPNLFKLTGKSWRFELFYYDFAIGAILLAILAAYTLGTMGSDLSFNDRMIVAGRTAQGLMAGSGFVFNLGCMLLMASISLGGMAAAVPLSISVAMLVTSFWSFRASNFFGLIGAVLLFLMAAIFESAACRRRNTASITGNPRARPATRHARPSAHTRRPAKAIATGVLGGILMGFAYPVARSRLWGDLGLGPYAAILLFTVGMLVSTIIFNFYFVNISIDGPPVRFNGYFQGRASQHFLGFAGGAMLSGGLLASLAAAARSAPVIVEPALYVALPGAGAILAVLWGTAVWREFQKSDRTGKPMLLLGTLLFASGLAVFSLAASH